MVANAGAGDVDSDGGYSAKTVGPVRLAGEVSIDNAYVSTSDGGRSTYKYGENDTLWVTAQEGSHGSYTTIDPSNLTYQWQVSDDKSWTDIEGATGRSLALAGYGGRYVRCHVRAKVGTSEAYAPSRQRNKVTPADAIEVAGVTLDTSDQLAPGDTITATATTQDGTDVTSSDKVTWSWWVCSRKYYTSSATQIEGQTRSSFEIPEDGGDYLGRYVFAKATTSAGSQSSSVAGPVKLAGAVTLWKVDVTGDAVVGGTLTATAYDSDTYKAVASAATVRYQWQYTTNASSYNPTYTDIPGATSASFTVPETITVNGESVSLLGAYLRVKATSDNEKTSTDATSSYGLSRSPVGPVSLKGAYDLTGVKLTSDKTNAQMSASLSAVAQYLKKGTYSNYNADVPDDAEVTYTWYQADDATTEGTVIKNETITGPTASTVTLSSDQLGKYVWVEASAKMGPGSSDKQLVVEEGAYDLHHVNLSPSSDEKILTGSEVSATAYASQLGSSTNTEVTGKDGVTVSWYVADLADAPDDQWTNVGTGSRLTVPTTAAGRYLRAVVTSGSLTKSATFANPVVDSNSLEGAVALLGQGYGWRPSLRYGTDTNINDVLKVALADKGFDTTGLTVKVKDVTFRDTNASAQVAIANEDSARNGDITYFYIDPDQTTSWGVTSLHTVKSITFELSRDGQNVEYTPSRTFQIPWDEAKLAELLKEKSDEIALGYTGDDSAESVTGNLTLPYKAGKIGSAAWTSVKWSSDSDAVSVSGYGWSDYTGKVTRHATDRKITLTATVTGSSSYDMPSDLSVEKTFDITVKADPEKAGSDQGLLASALDNYVYENVTDFSTKAQTDHAAITGDLQLPVPKTLGVDGKYYEVNYSATGDLASYLTFNGYHAQVVRPLDKDVSGGITCTVTDKSNADVTASKGLAFTVSKLDTADVDAEIALLDKVEAAYKDALLNGQNEPASQNLSTFQKAYLGDDGTVVFARSLDEASGHTGIVPTELPGYDSMGSYDQARTFKSSDTDVLLNETLQLAWNADRSTSLSQWHAQPQHNTNVTVSSRLASERFAGYYARYQNSADVSQELKDKLARLAGDDVSAKVKIAGATGQDGAETDEPVPTPEPKTVTTTVQVVVQNDDGSTTSWLSDAKVEIASGKTAADATKQALDAAGIGYDAGLYTFTRRGTSLGWNEDTGKYWNFYVNGTFSNRMASNVKVSDGDTYRWVYKVDQMAKRTEEPATNDVDVTPGKARPTETTADWSGFHADGGTATVAATPTSSADAAWAQKVYTRQGATDMAGVSDPIIVGGRVFVAAGERLQMRDASTGEVLQQATLATSIDSTCRMVYADGIIVVPLHGGRLQAVTPDDLTTVWVSDSVTDASGEQQSLSTLTVAYGYVYAGTSDARKTSGTLRRVSLADGSVDWSYTPSGSAYYWSGAAVTPEGVVIAQNSGELDLMSASGSNGSGRVIASLKLGSQVSSTVVADGSTVYVMGYDGTLYKVSVGARRLTLDKSVKLGSYSVSTPTVAGGRVYVGGSRADSPSGGALYVLDASTLEVQHTVTTFDDGTEIGGSVSSSPLVVRRGDETYVYFVPNDGSFGGVGVYRLGDATASKLYVPGEGQRDYSLSSVVVDSTGALYYVNDSGTLFKIVASPASEVDYPDVVEGEWYVGGIRFCRANGIMTGYADGRFGVGDHLTRAQFTTIVWRIAEPGQAASYDMGSAVNTTGIADVGDGQYYTGAANWAVGAGVVRGYTNEDGSVTFGAEDAITTEQLAVMLARYAGNQDQTRRTVPSRFADGDEVSGWARDSVAWACENGLIQGYQTADGGREIRPQESIPRERAATIIQRAVELGILVLGD